MKMFVLLVWKKKKKMLVMEYYLIECIALKETLVTELFVARYLNLMLLFVGDSHDRYLAMGFIL